MNYLFIFLVSSVIGANLMLKTRAVPAVPGCTGFEDLPFSRVPSRSDCNDNSETYTYTINAKRTSQTLAPSHPVVYMYYQISQNQNITYFKTVDNEHPFQLEYYLINSKSGYEYLGRIANICQDPPIRDWDNPVAKIIQGNLLPDGHCPVQKGSYDIPIEARPVTATLPKKMPCGPYTVTVNVDYDDGTEEDTWVLQVDYDFTITDNCKA